MGSDGRRHLITRNASFSNTLPLFRPEQEIPARASLPPAGMEVSHELAGLRCSGTAWNGGGPAGWGDLVTDAYEYDDCPTLSTPTGRRRFHVPMNPSAQ